MQTKSAALELFSAQGYDAVGAEIAKAVGIKAPSLYNHFPSKQAIFDALMQSTAAHYERGTDEITVRCHDAGAAWVQAVQGIAHGQVTVSGTADERLYRIPLRDIYYFEVVDGSSFLYCRQQVYGCRLRLYEFEALCSGTMLFRCSKSMVLNAEKLSYVRPSFSGRFEAVLDNGEKVIVSRLYVADLKRLFGA